MEGESERLRLREFTPEDYEDVHAYSSDYETVKHMTCMRGTADSGRGADLFRIRNATAISV